ncbi:hypothetical protein ATANTOWER_028453 [Ataeniobius toweri]|uniref:Uncharacterized protein n=1 Tax=Ataeniobius toweri TaxID=208326 RepID=A0ABU7BY41_9TELE|nr:hypothetical protein [Ataeniobius toweri]
MSFLMDDPGLMGATESDPVGCFSRTFSCLFSGSLSVIQSNVSTEVQLECFTPLCHPGTSDLQAAAQCYLVLFPVNWEGKLGESSAPVCLNSGSADPRAAKWLQTQAGLIQNF